VNFENSLKSEWRTINIKFSRNDFRRISTMKAAVDLPWAEFIKKLAFEKFACVICKGALDIRIINGITEFYCDECKKTFDFVERRNSG